MVSLLITCHETAAICPIPHLHFSRLATAGITSLSPRPLQVKCYDADYVEAQGYKSAIAVADEIRTLLEGSKKAGTCKGWDDIAAFSAVPQVWGCGV